MTPTSFLLAALLSASLWLVYQLANFVVSFYSVRTKFQRMQKAGLVSRWQSSCSCNPLVDRKTPLLTDTLGNQPMPPHHPLLGHLLIVANIMSKLPSDVHGHVLPRQISKTYPTLGPVFYIDTWPFGPPILALTSADAANQATVAHSLPKFAMLREYMKPMTGGTDLTTLEGRQWKTWRTVFNPGFSVNYLMTMVPQMLKDVLVFCDILEQRAADGQIFSLDPLTINLNLDIIGRLAL